MGGVPDQIDLDLYEEQEVSTQFTLQGGFSDPSSVDTQAGIAYDWTITKDGQPFASDRDHYGRHYHAGLPSHAGGQIYHHAHRN